MAKPCLKLSIDLYLRLSVLQGKVNNKHTSSPHFAWFWYARISVIKLSLNNRPSTTQFKFHLPWYINYERLREVQTSPWALLAHKSLCKQQRYIMITDQACHLFQNLSVIGHCLCYSIHTQESVSFAASLSSSDKPTEFIKWIIVKGNWPTKMDVQQRNKSW